MRTVWWWVSLAGLLLYTVSPVIPLLGLLMFYPLSTLTEQDSLAVALPQLLVFTLPSGLLALLAWGFLFFLKFFAPRT